MNSVQVMGNLARDPVVRATKTGRAMASFTVAVNRSFTTPQGEQITDWINVVAWGNLAEAVGNQLKKGSRVFVEGRFTTRSYDTPDGQRRWVSEVTANFVALPIGGFSHSQQQPSGNAFGGNNGYNGNNGYGGNNGGFNNGASPFGQSQPQGQPKSSFGQFGQASKDEDIPF